MLIILCSESVVQSNTQVCITLYIIWKFSTCSYSFICCLKTFKASWNLQHNKKKFQKSLKKYTSVCSRLISAGLVLKNDAIHIEG